MQKTSLTAKWVAAIIALTAWFGLGIQFYYLLHNAAANGLTKPEAIGRFFSYFTILSNLMVAVSTSAYLLIPESGFGRFCKRPVVLTGIAIYILMVGIGYNLLLRGTWNPQGWNKVADEVIHVADPILFVLFWYFFVPKNALQWKHIFLWLACPAAYLIYMLLRGTIDGFYPYSFLDPDKLGYSRMLLNTAGVGIGFIAAGLAFIKLGQWQEKRRTKNNFS